MSCFVMLLFHVFVAFVVDVCLPLFVIACMERDVELINNALYKVSQLTTSKLTLTLWRQYNGVLSQAVV